MIPRHCEAALFEATWQSNTNARLGKIKKENTFLSFPRKRESRNFNLYFLFLGTKWLENAYYIVEGENTINQERLR